MRPEKAYRLINNAFKPFYSMEANLKSDLVMLKSKQVRKAIDVMIEKSITYDKRSCIKFGDVYEEAPIYYEESLDDPDAVLGYLFYISDRWNCIGRLKFLKAVVEKY